jgi:MoxR-like ATPase
MSDNWKEWLNSVPGNEQYALFSVLKKEVLSELEFQKQTAMSDETAASIQKQINGILGTQEQDSQVKITRTPTEDLFVENCPAYLDIFHLHDVYKSLAYRSNILLKGPKGDGKTLSIITFAHITDTPIIIQECSEDTKKMDLMGSQTLLGDETIFTLGCIPAAIETANEYGRAILLLEELSALTPQVQKQLNAVTDFRRQCSMPFLGKTYKLKKDAFLWVVGTMNPSVYGGTYDLNEDLKSRFEEVDLTYPEAGQEKQVLQLACKHLLGTKMPTPYRTLDGGQARDITNLDDTILNFLIKLAGETRQQATGYALSTRDLVRVVETVGLLGLEKALQLVLCKFEGEEDKGTMRKRISSIFGPMSINNFWGVKSKNPTP